MQPVRLYGAPPYRNVVVHGGPGAGGEMAPVARELCNLAGVMEPIQSAFSIAGQVEELVTSIRRHATHPVILIGYSWGAWLSYLVAAHHPEIASAVILVSSGPLSDDYSALIHTNRMARLNHTERKEFEQLFDSMDQSPTVPDAPQHRRLMMLLQKTDAFDPLIDPNSPDNEIPFSRDIYRRVWPEAMLMRKRGELLQLGAKLLCPVIAIHGDHDPHPADGVEKPLSKFLRDFQFILLKNCGHTPWLERQARAEFFNVLKEKVKSYIKNQK